MSFIKIGQSPVDLRNMNLLKQFVRMNAENVFTRVEKDCGILNIYAYVVFIITSKRI